MKIVENKYIIEKKLSLWIKFEERFLNDIFDFSWNMSFAYGESKHRECRSGGNKKRKNGEIFANTFQGKLAEFALYQIFEQNNINVEYPDLEVYDRGVWDIYDLKVNDNLIAVKSTKAYGNLLLLETKDWNEFGEYIPNKNNREYCKFDYLILVRVNPSIDSILKSKRLLFYNSCNRDYLEKLLKEQHWEFDIPGFICNDSLVNIIKNNNVIPKSALLGKNTKMDAENYYIETGEMNNNLNELFNYFKIKGVNI